MPYSPVEYGPAVLCHIIFLLSSFEFLPLASEIIFALKGILFLVSAVFIWLFFTQYKSYTNYKDESVIHLWNPSPLSSFFLYIFSPIQLAIIFTFSHPRIGFVELISLECINIGLAALLYFITQKFLEREISLRDIYSGVQQTQQLYQEEHFEQVPKGDYYSHAVIRRKPIENDEPIQSIQKEKSPQPVIRTREPEPQPSYNLPSYSDNHQSMYHNEDIGEPMELDSEDITNIQPTYYLPEPEPLTEGPPVMSVYEDMSARASQEKPRRPKKSPSNIFQSGKKKRRRSSNPFQNS